jgi:hypothetical protein
MTTLTGWRANKSRNCGNYANQTCEPLSTYYRPIWYLDLLQVQSLPAGLLMCARRFGRSVRLHSCARSHQLGYFAFGFS